jgi:hypothetical protein
VAQQQWPPEARSPISALRTTVVAAFVCIRRGDEMWATGQSNVKLTDLSCKPRRRSMQHLVAAAEAKPAASELARSGTFWYDTFRILGIYSDGFVAPLDVRAP